MNRRDFTIMIANQILFAAQKVQPLGMAIQLDWSLRSEYDQYQCYKAGTSKCDGTNKVSAHQKGKAADLLLIGPNNKGTLMLLDPRESCPDIWNEIRQNWRMLGGEDMISWDPCHFEVK